MDRRSGYEYDFVLSFAGEDREIVEIVRDELRRSGLEVFYDKDEQDHLLGKDLASFFADLFQRKSRFCVVFVSQAYVEKPWCNWERQSALVRQVECMAEYIIPYYLEDVTLPSIPTNIGAGFLRSDPPRAFAQQLAKKYSRSVDREALTGSDEVSGLISDVTSALVGGGGKSEYDRRPLRVGWDGFDLEFRDSLKPGIYLVGGRPGNGRSIFALNVSSRALRNGVSVVYVSIGDSSTNTAMSLLSIDSGVSMFEMRRQKIRPDSALKLTNAASKLHSADLELVDLGPYPRLDQILLEISKITVRKQPRLIVIDKMPTGGTFFGAAGSLGPTAALRHLEWFAEHWGTTILVSCELSRSLEYRRDRRPRPTDIKGPTRQMLAHTHGGFLVYRPEIYQSFATSATPEPWNAKTLEVFVFRKNGARLRAVNLVLDPSCFRLSDPMEDYVIDEDPWGSGSNDDLPF